MIALLGASAIVLAGLQASIAEPTTAFRGCLHQAADKASSDKVTGDAIDGYLRNACTVQMGALKQALVTFRLKNGMTKKAADADAQMTIDDYVSTPADNYKFTLSQNAPKPQVAPAATATPPVKPAAQPVSSQPHN